MSERALTNYVLVGQVSELGAKTEDLAQHLVRHSMVIVMLWFGALKFTTYEADAIEGLVANSPFLGWLYEFLSVQAVSSLIGVIEITTGVLIAARATSAKLGALGGLLASCTFLLILSFSFSTPGVVEASAGGFPVLSVLPGQFLLKDLVLLAVSLWIFGEGLKRWDDPRDQI